MSSPFRNIEWDILVSCAKQICNPVSDTRIRDLVSQDADWPLIFRSAERHGLAGFLFSVLSKHAGRQIPEDVLAGFKAFFTRNSTRNFFLTAGLLKVLDLFKQKGISAVPFKGPVQSELLYGDTGLRTFSDLDILVKPDQAVQAKNLLEGEGFKTTVPIPESQLGHYIGKENYFQLSNPSFSLSLDIHWEMSGLYSLIPLGFPEKGCFHSLTMLGQEIQTLDPEDLLILLCVHGTKHSWDKLELLSSVGRLATMGLIRDWDGILIRAEALRCRRIVLLGLKLATDCLGAGLDPVILSAIREDNRLAQLSEGILEKLGTGEKGFSDGPGGRFSPLHFICRDSLSDSIQYGFRLFFRPTIREWAKYPLPDSLLFLYRFLRPYRLIKEGLLRQNA